jgi:hypothetical protein
MLHLVSGQVELVEAGVGGRQAVRRPAGNHGLVPSAKKSDFYSEEKFDPSYLSSRWIWNFCAPFMPSSAPKPWSGTLLEPVTNCRNLARSVWSKLRSARQNLRSGEFRVCA